MNREDSDAIDRALSEGLARSGPPVSTNETHEHDDAIETHAELQELAAYVDGDLSGSAREHLEGHLANCAACRRLAMETSLAVHGQVDAPRPILEGIGSTVSWWRPWRPVAGLATAAIAVAIGFFWLRPGTPTDAERLARIGVPDAAIEAAGPELVHRAARALAGHWHRPEGFDRFLADGRPVMRGASAATAPVPLAPRWSITDAERPRFTWWLDLAAAEYEILVVDESETLITAFTVPATAGEELSVTYPPDAAPLAPGKAYAWKVNARIADEWVASPYVPFIRATLEEQARHRTELGRATTSPLLRAVILTSSGRYRPALETLQSVDERKRADLIGSVLALQHFSAKDLEQQLRRWTSE